MRPSISREANPVPWPGGSPAVFFGDLNFALGVLQGQAFFGARVFHGGMCVLSLSFKTLSGSGSTPKSPLQVIVGMEKFATHVPLECANK